MANDSCMYVGYVLEKTMSIRTQLIDCLIIKKSQLCKKKHSQTGFCFFWHSDTLVFGKSSENKQKKKKEKQNLKKKFNEMQ